MHADHGERDEVLVERMEAGTDEFCTFVDFGAGILKEWTDFALKKLTMDDGHESVWEYDSIVVTKVQMFHDKVHLQHAVKR